MIFKCVPDEFLEQETDEVCKKLARGPTQTYLAIRELMLADMGADVLLVDRPGEPAADRTRDVLLRGRRSVVLDLKSESDRQLALALIERADVLIEGFRALSR